MRFISLPVALLAVVSAVSWGLLLTGETGAANPHGTPCVSPVNGRGATFQTNAEIALANPYVTDPVSPCAGASPLVSYNYPAAVGAGATGSGNGQKAASCRTDAFAGTDIPYDTATLSLLNGAPGATGGCAITFTPPNPPNSGTFPDPNDVQAPIMSFPIAAGAVGQGYHLTSSDCGGRTVGTLKLTGKMISLLIGGEIANWNDARLRTGGVNAVLSHCNVAVTRVVRLDKSGTTQIYKNYLAKVDPTRAGAVCDPGDSWTTLAQDAHNLDWPTGAGCSTLTRPATSGNPAVVTLCLSTDGSFCYGDIADFALQGLVSATVRNHANSSFVAALKTNGITHQKTQSNCDTSTATLPGTTAADAVGLNGSDNWASDNASGNHGNITNIGSAYPICGLTFALVYSGLHKTSGGAIAALSLNQRQTLFDYFAFVLTTAGQAHLGTQYYAPVTSTWLSKLRSGFKANF
jgi:ABC-type phosphate transport system substrate-binding protein